MGGLILTLRTDKPEAELGLYKDGREVSTTKWQAHRQLAETIHMRMQDLLEGQGYKWGDLDGIVCYRGPGSFTGLRIGFSVANSLAYSHKIPIVAAGGDTWQADGIKALAGGQNDQIALPDYGAPAKTTRPK